jgi:ATP-dependent RNA helicase DDX35
MTFWKPGTRFPGEDSGQDRETEREGAVNAVFNAVSYMSLTQQRQQLPIFQHRTNLLYLVEKYRVVIVVGETGSGKTTRTIIFCFNNQRVTTVSV